MDNLVKMKMNTPRLCEMYAILDRWIELCARRIIQKRYENVWFKIKDDPLREAERIKVKQQIDDELGAFLQKSMF